MASIIIKRIKTSDGTPITDDNEMRQQGMLEAGTRIAEAINAESDKLNPSFDPAFARAIVLDTLAAFITDPENYVVEYLDCPLTVTSAPNLFEYTKAGVTQDLLIKPVADGRVNKMSITVPIPVNRGDDVLNGYGTEVITDTTDLFDPLTSDAQKYLLASVMFRRCR